MKKDDENKRKKPATKRKAAPKKTDKARSPAKKAGDRIARAKKVNTKPASKTKPATKKATQKKPTAKKKPMASSKTSQSKRTTRRKAQPANSEPNYPAEFLKELDEAAKRNSGRSSVPVPRRRISDGKRTIEIPKGAKVRDIRVHYKFD